MSYQEPSDTTPTVVNLTNTVLSRYEVPFSFICRFLGEVDRGTLTVVVLDRKVMELETFQKFLSLYKDSHSTKEEAVIDIFNYLSTTVDLSNFIVCMDGHTSNGAFATAMSGNLDLREYL